MTAACRLDQVSVSLGSTQVVDTASIALGAGEVVGLIGPNGAGKTTLLRAALRLLPVEAGRIEFAGRDVTPLGPHELAGEVAYLPQGQQVHWPLSVKSIVTLGRQSSATPFIKLTQNDQAAVEQALHRTSMTEFADRPITSLSGGERARALLARVLAAETPVIFADEPVAALDPYHQLGIMQVFRDAASQGAGVLLVLHDLSLAERFCDRLVMMNRGLVIADGPPDAVLTGENMAQVYGVTVERSGALFAKNQIKR